MTKNSAKRIIDALTEVNGLLPELVKFQSESNRIEGIAVTRACEVEALAKLLQAERLWVTELCEYVKVIQPDALLRDGESVPGVRVGKHIAPASGSRLVMQLCMLLDQVNMGTITPYKAHCEYEYLHPFTDGNGRSGRALWLWMRKGFAPLGFLHQFYYDTLDANYSGK